MQQSSHMPRRCALPGWIAAVAMFGVGMLVAIAGSGCVGEPLTVIPSSLPTAVQGLAYSVQLDSDATGAEDWRIVGGNLPAGLSLGRQSGVLAGTPTQAGQFEFLVQVRSGIREGLRTYSLTVIAALAVPASLPNAQVNQSYLAVISPTGGVGPYTVSVLGLPAGLSFDATTRTISGMPLSPATRQLQIDVTDSGTPAQTLSRLVSLVILPQALQLDTTSLPAGTTGASYSQTVAVSGGTGPYQYSITDGRLPLGLQLGLSSGTISGTPTTAEVATFTLQVRDSSSPQQIVARQLSITVSAP